MAGFGDFGRRAAPGALGAIWAGEGEDPDLYKIADCDDQSILFNPTATCVAVCGGDERAYVDLKPPRCPTGTRRTKGGEIPSVWGVIPTAVLGMQTYYACCEPIPAGTPASTPPEQGGSSTAPPTQEQPPAEKTSYMGVVVGALVVTAVVAVGAGVVLARR